MSKKKPDVAGTFTEATAQFLASADWIGPEHAPAVVTLRLVAASLDQGLNPPLVAQYNLAYRNLLKQQPVDPDADDPVEQALRAAGQ